MPLPLLRRALRGILYTCATLFLLYLTLIAGPMWLTRIRIAHLLADFQSIRPTQSTWADAQRLMNRWGKWGHYDGTCTAQLCDYRIDVHDPITNIAMHTPERLLGLITTLRIFDFAERMGWRNSSLSLRFIIKRDIISSTQTRIAVQVPHFAVSQFDAGYTLLFDTQLRPRLREGGSNFPSKHWILGNNEQLADHPDYKVGRPGGCESCESYEVTYTPLLPHSEVIRLTAYDLSCLTRYHPCKELFDLLPAAHDWDLYEPIDNGVSKPIACHTDPRALGRDAETIIEVDPLSMVQATGESLQGMPPVHYELTTTRLVRVLKGISILSAGAVLEVTPFPGSMDAPNAQSPEHLIPGRRYLVLLGSESNFDREHFGPDRCGVLEATPENLQRLSLGIAEDLKYHDIDNPGQ